MNRKIKVLFLPRWYPHRYDPMPGLFIQRQAEALTKYCEVAVIYVHQDPHCPNKVEAVFSEENEVRVLRVYYKPAGDSDSLIGRFINLWRYYRNAMKAIRSIRQFSPDIIHGHILTRAGALAWSGARQYKCPFVISEHWSRYFTGNQSYTGLLRKMTTKFIVSSAAAVVAVSDPLKNAMINCELQNPVFPVIPNVVDTSMFFPGKSFIPNPVKTFVHVSCFDDKSKNISGFLRSVKVLTEQRQDFRCVLIGDGPDWNDMKDYASFLRIPEGFAEFPGVLNGNDLADVLRAADFSVLSSLYETFGTVVIESLACGTPVLSTKVGISTAVINDDNGILVDPGNEPAMTQALDLMLERCRSYNRFEISRAIAGKFDKETVGCQLVDLYEEVLIEKLT